MDIPQYGESSRSPQAIRTGLNGSMGSNGDTANGHAESLDRKLARLILPEWDVPPAKHLHVSHDAITLLHLDTLYNAHVRPYANPNIGEDGVKDEHDDDDMGETHGAKRKKGPKRRKMEKGYTHLIDDCIDPTPLGEGRNTHSLLPLIPDMMQPPLGPPPELYPDALTVLPSGIFQNARLEAGSKVDGYSNGVKAGVAEAEEKRRRKKLRQSQSALPPDLPSPALPSPMDSSELAVPVQPIAPPAHLAHRTPFPVNTTGRGAFRGGAGTPSRGAFRGRGAGPFTPSRGGTPGTPISLRGRGGFPGPGTPRGTPSRGGMGGMGGGTPRLPNPAWNRDGPGSGVKRPADGNSTYTPDPKRSKAGQESRSVSPFVGEQAGSTQGRPGIGKTPRSKTGE